MTPAASENNTVETSAIQFQSGSSNIGEHLTLGTIRGLSETLNAFPLSHSN